MNINPIITSALSDVGAPVSFQVYNGKEATYITFFQYNQISGFVADDVEQITSYYIQVDIWSKENYTNLVESVKTRMYAAGFRRTTESDLYERDTEYFHKALRFRLN